MSLRPVVLTTILSLLAGVVEPARAATSLVGEGFCYWPINTFVLDKTSGGSGSSRTAAVTGTGRFETLLIDSQSQPCSPSKLTRDCTASATTTLDYGVVAAQMTAQASFSPANYACQDGSSGPTGQRPRRRSAPWTRSERACARGADGAPFPPTCARPCWNVRTLSRARSAPPASR